MLRINGDALVIVAHPDDETIWMGGTILKNKNCRWTIFSLCRSNDKDRAPKFKKVCEKYGARGIISDLEDEGIMNISNSIPEIEKRIKKTLKRRGFDYLFTHAPSGEYGHPRHKGVSRAVRSLMRKQYLKAGSALVFDYPLDEKKGCSVPGKNAKIKFHLSQPILEEKRNIIHKIYGFSKNSFEFKSCSGTEAFNKLK